MDSYPFEPIRTSLTVEPVPNMEIMPLLGGDSGTRQKNGAIRLAGNSGYRTTGGDHLKMSPEQVQSEKK
eukprot:scaffold58727_cov48-Attheya_sp.AAC.1